MLIFLLLIASVRTSPQEFPYTVSVDSESRFVLNWRIRVEDNLIEPRVQHHFLDFQLCYDPPPGANPRPAAIGLGFSATEDATAVDINLAVNRQSLIPFLNSKFTKLNDGWALLVSFFIGYR
ncbi:hypothetical protein Ciccas_005698 [Cichlidogyrus casuarinus]|uniref:Uncharacterized protein n=1 Tax=Cichlidogyrus casuarinus TaxID=1844966 RepID=A0ABD2Q7Z0_9PLAT